MAGVQATHNPCLHKFCIVIGDEEAVLLYRDEGDYTWDAYHTEVPHSQRGKGLGAILAQVKWFLYYFIVIIYYRHCLLTLVIII